MIKPTINVSLPRDIFQKYNLQNRVLGHRDIDYVKFLCLVGEICPPNTYTTGVHNISSARLCTSKITKYLITINTLCLNRNSYILISFLC